MFDFIVYNILFDLSKSSIDLIYVAFLAFSFDLSILYIKPISLLSHIPLNIFSRLICVAVERVRFEIVFESSYESTLRFDPSR